MRHQERAMRSLASLVRKIARRPGKAGRIDAAVMGMTALIMTALYLRAYSRHPSHPHDAIDVGWWTWFDQIRYFDAAVAWSQGDLDPARHWYLPGYALMAAPFIRLFSVHAFLVSDLVCLLASLWLFCRLAGHLGAGIPHAVAYGALIFAAVTSFSPLGLDIWVVPWSTTGAVPLVYACLLAALHFIAQPGQAKFAFRAGLAGGLVAFFRTTDAVPLLSACAIGMTAALLRNRPGWKSAILTAAAGMAGVTLALAALAGAYLPVHGLHLSGYIAGAARVGFDWGLVPLHWVALMLDPQPWLNEGQGLIPVFPWIALGMAGFSTTLLWPMRATDRLAHVTVILAVVLYTLLYLAYRDLHSDGLFRFRNYHYFKWVYPVLALYAALLLQALWPARRSGNRSGFLRHFAIPGVALACLVALLCWRTDLRAVAVATGARVADDDPDAVVFDSLLTSVNDGLLVPAAGGWDQIYFGAHTLTIAGQSYIDGADFKLFPRSAGFLLMPLRPLPAGPARLVLHDDVTPDPTAKPLAVRERVLFGLPCWLPLAMHRCAPEYLIAAPSLPASLILVFDRTEERYLTGGWSTGDASGRWTDGALAGLRMRIDGPTTKLGLTIEGSAYVPAGATPLQLRVLANGREILARRLATGETVTLLADLSPETLALSDLAGSLTLSLAVANPRRPMDYDHRSADARQLGFFVRRISLSIL